MELVLATTERNESIEIEGKEDFSRLEIFLTFAENSDIVPILKRDNLIVFAFETKKEFLLLKNFWSFLQQKIS